MRRGIKKIYTGIEVTRAGVNAARVGYGSSGWSLLKSKSIVFPEEVIRFSYRNKNILKPDLFIEAVREVAMLDGKSDVSIGVALPNEIVKVSIQEFGELPELESEVERMVTWTMERLYHFSSNTTQSSYHRIGWSDGFERLLVTTAAKDVVREYELLFKQVGLNSEVVKPSAISQFNFYSHKLPEKGCVAFIGLFKNFFTFYVFKKGRLSFYQGVKKGVGSDHYLDEMDMCFEYYLGQNPDDEIEKLYVGGFIGEKEDALSVFSNFGNMDIHILDESQLIGKGKELDFSGKREEIAPYASAIGVAQGLVN